MLFHFIFSYFWVFFVFVFYSVLFCILKFRYLLAVMNWMNSLFFYFYEDSFDYELPVQQEPSKYDHLVQEEPFDYELPIQQEPSEYDLPADEERDNLPEWDDFDEGAVSLGVKHDNFALAESSDMWTSANDPATVEQPSHPTPVRRSISERMPFSPASPPPSTPPMSQ